MQEPDSKFIGIENPGYRILKLAFRHSLPFLVILMLAFIIPITPSDKAGVAFILIPIYLIYFFIISIPILQNPSLNKFGFDFSFFLYNVSTGELIRKDRNNNTFINDLRQICSSLFKNSKDVYLCDYPPTIS